MNVMDQIQQVELSIEQAENYINVADALDRLHDNKDFEKVIIKGLFEEEAARTVLLKSEPAMAHEAGQKDLDNIITMIGGLFQYFNKIYAMANQAKMAIEADRDTLEELRTEELNEGGRLQ